MSWGWVRALLIDTGRNWVRASGQNESTGNRSTQDEKVRREARLEEVTNQVLEVAIASR